MDEKKGIFVMSDISMPGRPLTVCEDAGAAAIQQSLAEDRGNSCEKIDEDVLISKSSVQRIITDKHNKKQVFFTWAPHLLTPDQKDCRVIFSRQFIERFQREQNRFLDQIVTGDKNVDLLMGLETKRRSAE
ncbi:histone-lysine N-methyltransferase SETMAR [Plakobranchus ocellatus]|uniref:Histone-lysine N-methyltransferase SETMAR n=1 Tax=Plakobranchus ocellatus TaxID=259542 RepID=A0AAV4AMF1_9GAST|nr:histone-lysine N-methyltransferase SETMAR [Plakobranchus ocellatus]